MTLLEKVCFLVFVLANVAIIKSRYVETQTKIGKEYGDSINSTPFHGEPWWCPEGCVFDANGDCVPEWGQNKTEEECSNLTKDEVIPECPAGCKYDENFDCVPKDDSDKTRNDCNPYYDVEEENLKTLAVTAQLFETMVKDLDRKIQEQQDKPDKGGFGYTITRGFRNAFDVPDRCPEGCGKDDNGDCVPEFGKDKTEAECDPYYESDYRKSLRNLVSTRRLSIKIARELRREIRAEKQSI